MWRKGNPCALSVGMQIDEAAVKNSVKFLRKIENGPGWVLSWLEHCPMHQKVCRFNPQSGCVKEATDGCLLLSPPLSLSQINRHILGWLLKKLKMGLPYESVIPLQCIYLKKPKTLIRKNTCMFRPYILNYWQAFIKIKTCPVNITCIILNNYGLIHILSPFIHLRWYWKYSHILCISGNSC